MFSSTRNMVVAERNLGNSTIKDVSTELNTVLLVESESHLVANILSSILEIPIVIIESTLEKYVRLFLPTVIQVPGNSTIYLAHNTKDDAYYNTEEKGKQNQLRLLRLHIFLLLSTLTLDVQSSYPSWNYSNPTTGRCKLIDRVLVFLNEIFEFKVDIRKKDIKI